MLVVVIFIDINYGDYVVIIFLNIICTFKMFISQPDFGSTHEAHWANEATSILGMGRPMAPQIGLEAMWARTKARSGSTHSHPEVALNAA